MRRMGGCLPTRCGNTAARVSVPQQYTAVQCSAGGCGMGMGRLTAQPGEASLAVVRDDRMVRPGISPTIRSDPIRSDPIRSDPIRSDPIRSDPIRSDQAAKA